MFRLLRITVLGISMIFVLLAPAGGAQSQEPNPLSVQDEHSINVPSAPTDLLFSYQGQITNPNGEPINDPAASMTFRLYPVVTGGTSCWSESQTVAVENGLFSVLLGQIVTIDPVACLSNDAYLELEINGEPLAPRELLASVPFAAQAQSVTAPLNVPGAIYSSGSEGGQLVAFNPNNNQASVGLSWLNDVARIRVGGSGAGSVGGLDIQTQGDVSLFRLLHNGNVGISTAAPPSVDLAIGDSDTGFQQQGDGRLAIFTNNQERVRVMNNGAVGIGITAPVERLEVAGNISLSDNQLYNVRGVQLKDWDDDTGGNDDKYRVLGRDGAWQFSNGGVVVGSYNNGTWTDLPDGTLIVENKASVGTTDQSKGTLSVNGKLAVEPSALSSWPGGWGDGVHTWDLYAEGTIGAGRNGQVNAYIGYDGNAGFNSVSCGGLVESNLQTEDERDAGRIDRFQEGDVLCWGIDQLELCDIANDRLVQAVADDQGRPIVIGAELVKVLGPVQRGDILVASNVPGYAMVNDDPLSGSVIAQALENFSGGQGVVKAMIRKW